MRKSGIFTIYENGINIGSDSLYKTREINLSDFSIGGLNYANLAFEGYIDDFAVYNYARWSDDFVPPTSPVIP